MRLSQSLIVIALRSRSAPPRARLPHPQRLLRPHARHLDRPPRQRHPGMVRQPGFPAPAPAKHRKVTSCPPTPRCSPSPRRPGPAPPRRRDPAPPGRRRHPPRSTRGRTNHLPRPRRARPYAVLTSAAVLTSDSSRPPAELVLEDVGGGSGGPRPVEPLVELLRVRARGDQRALVGRQLHAPGLEHLDERLGLAARLALRFATRAGLGLDAVEEIALELGGLHQCLQLQAGSVGRYPKDNR